MSPYDRTVNSGYIQDALFTTLELVFMPQLFKYSRYFHLLLSLSFTTLLYLHLSPRSLYAKEPSIRPPKNLSLREPLT